MKYVLLLMGDIEDERCGANADGPGPEEFIAFDAELEEAGVLAGGFALEDPETGVSVSIPRGESEAIVTSGPHPETREFVGGTIVIDVPDIDEALKWATRCPGAQGGRIDVRAMLDI